MHAAQGSRAAPSTWCTATSRRTTCCSRASGSLKLIDFGIAKAATNRNLTMPGVTKGKAGYFSPEQAMGKPLDGRSDLFSLGVTLYKLA